MASGARGLALAAVVRLVVAATTGGESNLVERVPGDIPNEKAARWYGQPFRTFDHPR
jgi:hypothetical protein